MVSTLANMLTRWILVGARTRLQVVSNGTSQATMTKALGDVERTLAEALDKVQREVATVTTAVDRMNKGTTRLMYVSIALAVIAVAITIVSLV